MYHVFLFNLQQPLWNHLLNYYKENKALVEGESCACLVCGFCSKPGSQKRAACCATLLRNELRAM